MHLEINPKTGRAVKVYDSLQERLDSQNNAYKIYRQKLEANPAKLAEYKARKNAASKKCLAKKAAEIEQLKAELEALKANS